MTIKLYILIYHCRMPNKCCVAGCKTYHKLQEKENQTGNISLYSFPKNIDDRERWLAALPNKVFEPSKNMKVCSRHWETETDMIKVIVDFYA